MGVRVNLGKVTVHTLPASKRYPETESEHEIIVTS